MLRRKRKEEKEKDRMIMMCVSVLGEQEKRSTGVYNLSDENKNSYANFIKHASFHHHRIEIEIHYFLMLK